MSEGFSHIPVYSDHSPNFIGVWSFENHKFCDDIIEFFEHNPTMHSDVGFVDYKDEKRKVKYEKKFVDAKQTIIRRENLEEESFSPILEYLNNNLKKCYQDYISRWTTLARQDIGLSSDMAIVRFKKSQKEYNEYSYRRKSGENLIDTLNFRTFLNTPIDGGEINFYYYGLSFKPVKGLTLIYPTDWTHANISENLPDKKQDSYMITGSLGFCNVKEHKTGMTFEEIENLDKKK